MRHSIARILLLVSIPTAFLPRSGTAGNPDTRPLPQESAWTSLAAAIARSAEDYRIGDDWGKLPVTPEQLATATPEFVRAAKVTSTYGGGTAFYIGKFHGHHLMGTNHHVQASMNCRGLARFQVLGAAYPCRKVLGHWPEIDFALFEITVPASDEAVLAKLAKNFSFDRPLTAGQLLLTIGHGIASNPGRRLVANQDSDCKVFSDEVRLMGDPDEYNPGEYQAWSFANGCDVSHGDSGSAMIDRLTGEPVGIIWTGRIPKSSEAQSSATLDDWLRTGSHEIWKQLSYGVPATKIHEVLEGILESDTSLDRETVETLRAFLDSRN